MPGRCAGCGVTNSSCKVIKTHVMRCPEYLELFRTDPAKALEPEAEYKRWKASGEEQETKAANRETKIAGMREREGARHGREKERWGKSEAVIDL